MAAIKSQEECSFGMSFVNIDPPGMLYSCFFLFSLIESDIWLKHLVWVDVSIMYIIVVIEK